MGITLVCPEREFERISRLESFRRDHPAGRFGVPASAGRVNLEIQTKSQPPPGDGKATQSDQLLMCF